jgi:hypothetical protein
MEKSEPPEITPSRPESGVGETLKLSTTANGQGAALYHEIQEYSPEELEAESAKVLRLIDWNITPIVSFLSGLGGRVERGTRDRRLEMGEKDGNANEEGVK